MSIPVILAVVDILLEMFTKLYPMVSGDEKVLEARSHILKAKKSLEEVT